MDPWLEARDGGSKLPIKLPLLAFSLKADKTKGHRDPFSNLSRLPTPGSLKSKKCIAS